jgi:20S proteasome alpha/beta subunit
VKLTYIGSYFPWRATAIGRNASSAKQFLEKRYNPDMELEDAIHTALLTLKEGFEGEMTSDTVEIGWFFVCVAYDRHCERACRAFTWF